MTSESRIYIQWGEKQPLQKMMLGELDSYMQMNQNEVLSHTICKNKLKMYSRLKCKTRSDKTPTRKNMHSALFFLIYVLKQGKENKK